VSRRREVEEHLRTLALLVTRKLARYLATQQRVLATIEAAAADFHRHYPLESAAPAGPGDVRVVIGSERGLCGDFNDKLRQALDGYLQQHGDSITRRWTSSTIWEHTVHGSWPGCDQRGASSLHISNYSRHRYTIERGALRSRVVSAIVSPSSR